MESGGTSEGQNSKPRKENQVGNAPEEYSRQFLCRFERKHSKEDLFEDELVVGEGSPKAYSRLRPRANTVG